jgi:hypothetical protein
VELEAGVRAGDDQFGLAPCGAGATLTEQDGRIEDLVNLVAAASAPHAELPLPLLDGTPDRPNDAATVAVVENFGRKGGS